MTAFGGKAAAQIGEVRLSQVSASGLKWAFTRPAKKGFFPAIIRK